VKSIRVAAAVAIATAVGFSIHVLYGRGWANDYLQQAAHEERFDHILREPYPAWLVVIAALTAMITMAAKVLVFVLIRDRLPGTSGLVKGLWYGVILLAFNEWLIRMPIMAMMVGNDLDLMVVQGLEHWAIALLVGPIIGVLTPPYDVSFKRSPQSA
jgi:hypothetical protein